MHLWTVYYNWQLLLYLASAKMSGKNPDWPIGWCLEIQAYYICASNSRYYVIQELIWASYEGIIQCKTKLSKKSWKLSQESRFLKPIAHVKLYSMSSYCHILCSSNFSHDTRTAENDSDIWVYPASHSYWHQMMRSLPTTLHSKKCCI